MITIAKMKQYVLTKRILWFRFLKISTKNVYIKVKYVMLKKVKYVAIRIV